MRYESVPKWPCSCQRGIIKNETPPKAFKPQAIGAELIVKDQENGMAIAKSNLIAWQSAMNGKFIRMIPKERSLERCAKQGQRGMVFGADCRKSDGFFNLSGQAVREEEGLRSPVPFAPVARPRLPI